MPGEAVSLLPSFSTVHDAGTDVSVISEQRAQPHIRRLRLDVTARRGKSAIGHHPHRATCCVSGSWGRVSYTHYESREKDWISMLK